MHLNFLNLLGASVVVTGDSVVVMTSSLTAVTTAEKPPRPIVQSDSNTTIISLDKTLSCLATVTSPMSRFVPPDWTSYTVTWSAPFSTSTSSKLTNNEWPGCALTSHRCFTESGYFPWAKLADFSLTLMCSGCWL